MPRQRPRAGRLTERGQIFDLMDELENSGNVHRSRIAALEQLTQRNIVWYHANMGHPLGGMISPDADLLENVIGSLDLTEYDGIDLYLTTPGGLPEVAARMLRSCRSRMNSLRVVVPSQAMSAGTLLAMGADEIVMGPATALGPVDPQMVMQGVGGTAVRRPAKHFIDAYERIVKDAQDAMMAGRPPQPFLQQLAAQDPSFIVECGRARDATKQLGARFLLAAMYSGRPAEEAAAVVDRFIKHGDEGTHGMPIWADEAKAMGLKVKVLDGNSDEWRLTREVFVRYELYVGSKGLAKAVGCRAGGMDMNVRVQAMPMPQ
jgi:ATP-dependent protease ClpP protease subunit